MRRFRDMKLPDPAALEDAAAAVPEQLVPVAIEWLEAIQALTAAAEHPILRQHIQSLMLAYGRQTPITDIRKLKQVTDLLLGALIAKRMN